ncbi:MAG TPA: glycoside hydrolase family 31 protein [Solirubrobacterales bacterium]|nr:glycoside hydrolase family 31 protein [Solirubrobacterales bacterium]
MAVMPENRTREASWLVDRIAVWSCEGVARDQLITLTEGVIPHEERGERRNLDPAEVTVTAPAPQRVLIEAEAPHGALRVGAAWPLEAGERLTGLGARHGLDFDQRDRCVNLGSDRRYTGPDCPPELLADGGIPQGDYAPVPWLLSSAGWAAWLETGGAGAEFDLGYGAVSVSVRAAAGPLRLHLFVHPSPAARLRAFLHETGLPELQPEWAYGHWKSRDVYEHQRDVEDDWRGYRENELPLDAIVIDSPWETQYNTWRFNPHQFPDAAGMVRGMRADGVRTVVWVTPWVNLESIDGQRPPDPESERMHREPAPNYEEGAREGHFVRNAAGDPHVGRWWMGTGSVVDFTSAEASEWWKRLARPVFELGVEGVKADDGEGYYFPPDVGFADGRTGAEAAWEYGALYRRVTQEALEEVHDGPGVVFGRSGWTGQQATGFIWGGDQASDFWSLRALVASLLTSAASGFSNLSHDVGGYLGRRLTERCEPELLVRWAQLGALSPLMQAHGRFEQEAWTYDEAILGLYREAVLLHERLVPYITAAAATAARTGLPAMRPLCLVDPGDPEGWRIADSYFLGPALWVAPVVEEGARTRRAYLPSGQWIDWWNGERLDGGRWIDAEAPLERIPLWVREGSLVVTYPADQVTRGLGEEDPGQPVEATLWGEPPLSHARADLADGTAVRWRAGEWSVEPKRPLITAKRGAGAAR